MASNFDDLLEEWDRRADDLWDPVNGKMKRDAAQEVKRCMEDLKDTLIIMEANAVLQQLKKED